MFKNTVLTILPLWFCFYSQWSGQVYLDPWIRTLWNLIFTAAPIIVYSILEQDLPETVILMNPELYADGQQDSSFNGMRFSLWMFYSVLDSLCAFFGVIYTAYGLSQAVDWDGHTGDLWAVSTTSYTIMCVSVNLHLFIHTRYWNCLTQWVYWLTLLSWFAFAPLYCTMVCVVLGGAPMYGVMMQLYSTPLFYLTVILWSWVAVMPDFILMHWRRTFMTKAGYVLQEVVNNPQWKTEHPPTGKWCFEKEDCCCKCGKRLCCECC